MLLYSFKKNWLIYWTEAFGKDGLLKTDYPYYEGNHYNYTFRFIRDKEKRIEIAGGKENLVQQLDKFFAIDETSEMQNRFEGFNNETDMETPYFYHYVGEYGKLCKIIDECINSCFTAGREGLPGNGDSGGLTACYLWNFLGLFPISGQEEVLSVEQAKELIDERRIEAIVDAVRSRIDVLQEIAKTHTPVEDTIDGDVEENVAADYLPKS